MIETILHNEGIMPNLMDSLEMFKTCPEHERDVWKREFMHWYGKMKAYNEGVADKYKREFEDIKKDYEEPISHSSR